MTTTDEMIPLRCGLTTTDEIWKPVLGYEGSYEVSSRRRVRGLDRYVHRGGGTLRRAQGRILQPWPFAGEMYVKLQRRGEAENRTVTSLWHEAFGDDAGTDAA